VAQSGDDADWIDLTGNIVGRHMVREKPAPQGTGSDLSPRPTDAEAEYRIAETLMELTRTSMLDRLRHRMPPWWVLHSVPIGTCEPDIDHVACGPPGIFTINTKYHPASRVDVDNDKIAVNKNDTEYAPTAEAMGQSARQLLCAALRGAGEADLVRKLIVRPVVAIVGARVVGRGQPHGVIVATPANLQLFLREQPPALSAVDVQRMLDIARRSTTWTEN
jgi:hypothetical protein